MTDDDETWPADTTGDAPNENAVRDITDRGYLASEAEVTQLADALTSIQRWAEEAGYASPLADTSSPLAPRDPPLRYGVLNDVSAYRATPFDLGIALKELEPRWLDLAIFATSYGFVVTSINQGQHVGTAHYTNEAIDLRTKDKTRAQGDQFIRDARLAGYKIIDARDKPDSKAWSAPHIHMEVGRRDASIAVVRPDSLRSNGSNSNLPRLGPSQRIVTSPGQSLRPQSARFDDLEIRRR